MKCDILEARKNSIKVGAVSFAWNSDRYLNEAYFIHPALVKESQNIKPGI